MANILNFIPEAHYKDACDAIREKDGSTGLIKSGELGAKIRAIRAERAKLLPATIALSGDTVSITNGNNGAFATEYHIYIDGLDKATVKLPTSVFDLKTIALGNGTHKVHVVTIGTNMEESINSNIVEYAVQGLPIVTVNVVNANEMSAYAVYDANSWTGTPIKTIDGSSGSLGENKYKITSGYISLTWFPDRDGNPMNHCSYSGGLEFVSESGGNWNNCHATWKVTGDGYIDGISCECFVKGTKITLADGSQKNVEDITYQDDILVWNFDKGIFASAKPVWIMKSKKTNKYNKLTFADGRELLTVNQHRIYNLDAGKFTYPMTEATPIGATTFAEDGSYPALVSKEVINGEVEYYNLITDYHMNCFANGILTSCRLNNLYPIENMKFVKEDRAPKNFNVPEKYQIGLRLAEQPEWAVISKDADLHGNSYEEYVQNLIKTAK